MSFENPGAPSIFHTLQETPQIQVAVDVAGTKLDTQHYEVTLHIKASATHQENAPVFIAEVAYAGVFLLQQLPQESYEPVLFVHAPTLLFPFARRVLADITRDGGFAPLLLDPMDFATLYQDRKANDTAHTPS
jgi:preprotein translocase subunit SecB